jgi:hypothetical protein
MNTGFRRRRDLEIDPAEPFALDKLGFDRLAPPLTRLLEKTPGPYVIAVNAEYGIGKTTFLKMWRAFLDREGARTLFFDAWEHDFIEPPLTALIGELETQIEKIQGVSAAKRKLHKSGLAAIGALAPIGAREASKVLLTLAAGTVAGAAGSQVVSEALERLSGGMAESISQLAKDRIKQYEKEKKTLAAFRTSLGEFATLIRTTGKAGAASRFLPLVFFIDELDRCRPTYAIELLETVKHLFAVEGVVFVLGINREALGQSMQAVYGQNFPGSEYLRRFIDLQYTLPKPSLGAFCTQLATEFIPKRQYPIHPGANYLAWTKPAATEVNYGDILALVCHQFAHAMGRSLRDLEQIFSRAGAALATLREDEHVEPCYFSFLMLAQDAFPHLYRPFIAGGGGPVFIRALLEKGIKLRDSRPLDAVIMEGITAQHEGASDTQKRANEYRQRAQQQGNSGVEYVRSMLLANGTARLKLAPRVVELSEQFEQPDS